MDKSSIEGNDPKPEDEKKHNFQMVEVEGIGHLPRDLVIEILSRIPAKDLCKLRCVSKSWNVLLSRDIEFIAQHIQWWKQKPLLLVRRYLSDSDGIGEPSQSRITIECTSIDMHGEVIDKFEKQVDGPVHKFISCGPLTLLCCMNSLYVCNPSIHEIVGVPFPSSSRLYNTGFGFLPSSNEYKIVHMFPGPTVENGKMGCEVFSFRTGEGVSSTSWRRIKDYPSSAWIDEYLLCINGTIYWAISSGWKEKSILSLDLKTEEFSTISYPIHESKTTEYSFLEYIGVAGSLCLAGFSAEASRMDIWMLKDKRKGKWSVEHSINLFPWCPKLLIPCDEEILVQMEGMDLVSYNLKSGRTRRIGWYKAMKAYNKPCLYYNSLVPMY